MTTTLLSWQRRSFEAWLHKVCVSFKIRQISITWFVHFNRKRPVLAVLFISLQLFNQFMTEDKLPSLKTKFSETHNKPLKTQVFWELSRWSLSDLTCNVEARRFPSTSNHFDQDPVEWISMTENKLLQLKSKVSGAKNSWTFQSMPKWLHNTHCAAQLIIGKGRITWAKMPHWLPQILPSESLYISLYQPEKVR